MRVLIVLVVPSVRSGLGHGLVEAVVDTEGRARGSRHSKHGYWGGLVQQALDCDEQSEERGVCKLDERNPR